MRYILFSVSVGLISTNFSWPPPVTYHWTTVWPLFHIMHFQPTNLLHWGYFSNFFWHTHVICRWTALWHSFIIWTSGSTDLHSKEGIFLIFSNPLMSYIIGQPFDNCKPPTPTALNSPLPWGHFSPFSDTFMGYINGLPLWPLFHIIHLQEGGFSNIFRPPSPYVIFH